MQTAGKVHIPLPEKPGVELAAVGASMPVPQKSDSSRLIDMIERALLDTSIDLQRLKELLDLRKTIHHEQAQQAFAKAMRDAQAEIPQIFRDAKNSDNKSRYARLETIGKVVDPIITKHGLTMSFGADQSHLADHYGLTCKVSHIGGHSEHYRADLPIDATGLKGTPNKTRTHAFGSTMTYGRRYLMMMIFNIKLTNDVDDDDGNAAGKDATEDVGTITDVQVETLQQLLKDAGSTERAFCTFAGVARLEDIHASKYERAYAAIEAKLPAGHPSRRRK